MGQPTPPSEPTLAHSDAQASADQPSERQGGVAADPLEMVVWLEGHEPYVAEFCLNADQAMARLGIKRSRLNQISGKELRVGRIKSGRYIKPMYRETDIEGYLQWTRPTASHQASKRALESATAGIDAKLDSLAARLDEQLTAAHKRANKIHHTVAVEVMEWLAPTLSALRQELAAIKHDLEVSQFERKQLTAAVGRQRRSAEERAEQLCRTTLDIQHAIAVSQQSLNLAGRLEAQNGYFASQLTALAASLTTHIDRQVAGAARSIAVLSESHEQFVTTEFPGIIHASQQASLDAVLGQLSQNQSSHRRTGLNGGMGEGPRGVFGESQTKGKKPKRSIKRRYSASARRKPSLLSHRG